MSRLSEFGKTARGLARNPLGIIALFIVLIYGFASLVVGLSGQLERMERFLIVCFLVTFPVMVLGVFAWLVCRHHTKLYAPSDFRADDSFLQVAERRAEFAAGLGAASARHTGDEPAEDEDALDAGMAASIATRTVTLETIRAAQRRHILWVDDRPWNNAYERHALSALGFRITISQSTEDALDKLRMGRFDVIISDMGRPPDDRAGYTLPEAVRDQGIRTPYLIYAGSRKPEHQREALKSGAQGTTNRPEELLEMVLESTGVGSTI